MSEVSPEEQLPPEEQSLQWSFPRYLDEFETVIGPAFTDPVLQEVLEAARNTTSREEEHEAMALLPEEELDLRNAVYVSFLRILVEERRKIRTAPRSKASYNRSVEETLALNGRFEDSLTEEQLQVIRIKHPVTTHKLKQQINQINAETPEYSYDTPAEEAEAPDSADSENALYTAIFGEAATEEEGSEYIIPEATPVETTVIQGLIGSKTAEEDSSPEQEAVATLQPELTEHLFEHQVPYVKDIAAFLREPPQQITLEDEEGNRHTYTVHGATVEASTGIGKTLLTAKAAIAADIGELNQFGKRNDMLIVVRDRMAVRQFTGEIGDDTFRRYGPKGIRVVGLDSSSPKLDHEAEVTVTTIDQFVRHMRGGYFKGKFFGLLAIDEVHALTQPLFKQAFLEQWHVPGNRQRPLPAIGFTATSQYNEKKDAKLLLPRHIKHGETVDFMDRGILSSGQFFTIIAEPEYDILTPVHEGTMIPAESYSDLRTKTILQTVKELARPLLQEGRRGIIFCDAGDKSANAVEMARILTELGYPAEALYNHGDPKRAAKIIADYHAGKLKVLTSVEIGTQSLNADFNFVGIAGNVHSVLKLKQIVGRGIGSGERMSDEYPVTTFFHVIAGHMGKYVRTATFADALEVDELAQGAIVGSRSSSSVSKKAPKGAIAVEDLPESIQMSIRRVRTYTSQKIRYELNGTMPSEPIPADYIPFTTIYAPLRERIDEPGAKRRLDRAGYAWVGELISGKDDEYQRVLRHYEPSAATFFTENPLAPKVTDGWKNTRQTARHLAVSDTYVSDTLVPKMRDTCGLDGEPRLNERGRTFIYYGPDAIAWMEAEVAKIEEIQPGEANQKEICDQLEITPGSFVAHATTAGVTPTYKRMPGGKGFRWVYTPEQQNKIAKVADVKPMATDEDWSLPRIAREADVPLTLVHKMLTADEKAALNPLRTKTYAKKKQVKELDHLKEGSARQVVERLKAHKAANDQPWATDEEWTLTRVAKEAGVDPRRIDVFLEPEDKAAYLKRRAKITDTQSKVLNHLPQERAQIVIARIKKYQNTPWATSDDWSLSRIAELSGLRSGDSDRVRLFLTEEELAAVEPKRARTSETNSRTIDHLAEPLARAVLARMKSDGEPIPIHTVGSYASIKPLIANPPAKMPEVLKSSSPTVGLPLRKAVRFITWANLQKLGDKYGRSAAHPEIDFSQMPTEEDQQRLEAVTTDRELTAAEQQSMRRIIQGRALQLTLMAAINLGEPDGIID